MNVIAKISCYFERSVVTLKLRKEYLNIVIYNIPVLLWIKYWTVSYIERYSVSTYTGVTNFWKQSGFLVHPVYSCYYKLPWHFTLSSIIYRVSEMHLIMDIRHNYDDRPTVHTADLHSAIKILVVMMLCCLRSFCDCVIAYFSAEWLWNTGVGGWGSQHNKTRLHLGA